MGDEITDEMRAILDGTRASIADALASIDDLLSGAQPGFRDAWLPIRDPATGVRLFDWNGRRFAVRSVYRYHGERIECVVPLPRSA